VEALEDLGVEEPGLFHHPLVVDGRELGTLDERVQVPERLEFRDLRGGDVEAPIAQQLGSAANRLAL
jgi:hypothetical protein